MKKIDEKLFCIEFSKHLLKANLSLRKDVFDYFQSLVQRESLKPEEKRAVSIFIENARLAREEKRALCQDTGYVQVYLHIGREVSLDFDLQKAIDRTVTEVYQANHFRMSLADSVNRTNTKTNTPAFLHQEIIAGDSLCTEILIKGGGSENVTKAGFILPTSSREDIIAWVTDAVQNAGAKACPPYLVGVGVGGTLEKALHYSKRLLLIPASQSTMEEDEKRLALDILHTINQLPIGFQGLKFGDTAMSVNLKILPCHIATLPIAVSIGCNSVRQASFIL